MFKGSGEAQLHRHVSIQLHMSIKSKYFSCVVRLSLASNSTLSRLLVNSSTYSEHMMLQNRHQGLHARKVTVQAGPLGDDSIFPNFANG